jgi:hypothetical protein
MVQPEVATSLANPKERATEQLAPRGPPLIRSPRTSWCVPREIYIYIGGPTRGSYEPSESKGKSHQAAGSAGSAPHPIT